MIEDLKLIIPLAVYRKVMAYVTLCDLEISGFAEVEYNAERNVFIAGEPYLLKQNVTGTNTHMEEEDVSKFNHDYIKKGGTQLPRIWWHSHVNMGAFFSGTDEATLKDLQNDSFIIALVLNKRKEMKAKCYVASTIPIFNIPNQIEVEELPVTIELDYERIPESLRLEVEKKVTETKFEHNYGKWQNKKDPKLPYKNPLLKAGEETKLTQAWRLPKDPELAYKKVEDLNLFRTWSTEYEDFVYEDPKTGQVWIDHWQVLDDKKGSSYFD